MKILPPESLSQGSERIETTGKGDTFSIGAVCNSYSDKWEAALVVLTCPLLSAALCRRVPGRVSVEARPGQRAVPEPKVCAVGEGRRTEILQQKRREFLGLLQWLWGVNTGSRALCVGALGPAGTGSVRVCGSSGTAWGASSPRTASVGSVVSAEGLFRGEMLFSWHAVKLLVGGSEWRRSAQGTALL